MKGKWSAGPWRWSDEYTNSYGEATWSLIADDGYGILSCDMPNAPHNCNSNDARLIAEAPAMIEELIELLTECLAYYNLIPNNHRQPAMQYYQKTIDVIERATGLPIEEVLKGE